MTALRHPKTAAPDAMALQRLLGASARHWQRLVARLEATEGVTLVWKDYGAKHGWQLKVTLRKRALLYLITREGSFVVAFPLKPAVYEAVCNAALPEAFLREVKAAEGAPEGRPARVEVRDAASAALAERLLSVVLFASSAQT
jgi:hypothetical protein